MIKYFKTYRRSSSCIFRTATIATSLLLSWSCTSDRDGVDRPVVPDDEVMILTLRMPAKSPVAAYSMSVNDENAIETIDVLAFKVNGGLVDDSFLYMTEGNNITNANSDGSLKQFEVRLPWPEVAGERHRYVILANMRDIIPASIPEDTPKQDVLDALEFDTTDRWPAGMLPSRTKKPIPMWTQTNAVSLDMHTVAGDLGDLKMLRALARVDVGINYSGDTPQGLDRTFALEEVHVYKASTAALGVPKASAGFDGTKVYSPSIPGSNYRNPAKLTYDGVSSDYMSLEAEIYLAEVARSLPIDQPNAMALVIGGRYSDDPDVFGTEISYYRVDFMDDQDQAYDILRNHRYRINIISVSGPGWSGPDQAYNNRSENMEVEVMTWDEGEMDVIADGLWVLRTPSKLELPSSASQLNMIEIFTNVYGGWTADFAEGETHNWITIRNTSGRANAWDAVEVDVLENSTGIDREATLEVTAGRMSKQVKIIQKGGVGVVIDPWDAGDGFMAGIYDYMVKVSDPELNLLRGVPGQRPYLNYPLSNNGDNYMYFSDERWSRGAITTVMTDFPKGLDWYANNNWQYYSRELSGSAVKVWVDQADFSWLRISYKTTVQKQEEDLTGANDSYRFVTYISIVPDPIESYAPGQTRSGKIHYQVGSVHITIPVHQTIQNFVVPQGFSWKQLGEHFSFDDSSIMVAPGNQLMDGNQNWYTYMNVRNRYMSTSDYELNQESPARNGSCGQLNENNFLGYNDWRLPTREEATAILWYVYHNGGMYSTDYALNNDNLVTMDSHHSGFNHFYYRTYTSSHNGGNGYYYMNVNSDYGNGYNMIKSDPITQFAARCIRTF